MAGDGRQVHGFGAGQRIDVAMQRLVSTPCRSSLQSRARSCRSCGTVNFRHSRHMLMLLVPKNWGSRYMTLIF